MGDFATCKRVALEQGYCCRCATRDVEFYDFLFAPCGCCVAVCRDCRARPDMDWWAQRYARLHSYSYGDPANPDVSPERRRQPEIDRAGYRHEGKPSGCPRCVCHGKLVPRTPKPVPNQALSGDNK